MPQTLGEIVDVFKCCIFTWGALTTILPAFVIAGAIAVFLPPSVILKYLGAGAKKIYSYTIAAVTGFVLSVCSCNIVPLFASIRRAGAGLGPAFTFLYAGPAINLVAAVFVFKIIGPVLGIWRIIGIIVISLLIGLMMALIYKREEKHQNIKGQLLELEPVELMEMSTQRKRYLIVFFAALFAILLIGATIGTKSTPKQHSTALSTTTAADPKPGSAHSETSDDEGIVVKGAPPKADPYFIYKLAAISAILVFLCLSAPKYFDKAELKEWAVEVYKLLKLILPIFIPVVFAIALIVKYVPLDIITKLFGAHKDQAGFRLFFPTLKSTFIAAVFGELMYFPILTEVAFVKALLKLGPSAMDIGSGLAILLTGPGTSLPGFILIYRIAGLKKVLLYFGLLVIFVTIFSTALAMSMGDYVCSCTLAYMQ